MKKRKTSFCSKILYTVCRFFAKIKYCGTKIHGIDGIPKQNCIIVANHCQLNGPIIAELFMPKNCYIWANGQMFKRSDVPDYAMEDFFPFKPRWMNPICRLASYGLSLLIPPIMKNSRAIPVYRDMRIASTFKKTIKYLSAGNIILIFPECHKKNNNIVNEFQENFIDIGRIYARRGGEELSFIPMYIAPDIKRAYLGKEIVFNSKADIVHERDRIIECLTEQITSIARELPEHTVIPFDNIPRRKYISNKAIDSLPE